MSQHRYLFFVVVQGIRIPTVRQRNINIHASIKYWQDSLMKRNCRHGDRLLIQLKHWPWPYWYWKTSQHTHNIKWLYNFSKSCIMNKPHEPLHYWYKLSGVQGRTPVVSIPADYGNVSGASFIKNRGIYEEEITLNSEAVCHQLLLKNS